MKRIGSIRYRLECEDDNNPAGVPAMFVFELVYRYTPGEKPVRYYPDGSGYPGSPDEIEFSDCQVVDAAAASLSAVAEWFDVEKHREALEELVLQDVAE